ncbi:MAG: DHA2 family efflux MFS transporter permease subunit [Proteobacteria bacterium]|nr:DHA2 family efflux MFS transporter permease subunit [Pseudomonadota bacterium]
MVQAVAGSVEAEPPKGLRRWLIVASGILGTLLFVIAITGAGMVLPHMQGSFSAAPDQIAWVVTAFIVGAAVANVCVGWVSDRIGRRRLYLISLVGFTAVSALCGLADSLVTLVLLRVLQGIFGAALSPVGQAIVIDAFGRGRQGFGTSIHSMGATWGSFVGPFLAGYLAEYAGWRWVFFAAVPFGLLALAVSWYAVPRTEPAARRRLDWIGFMTLSLTIGAFMLMISRGNRLDWFDSAEIIAAGTLAAFALYVFVAHTATTAEPFVPLALFADRNFSIALLLIFVFGGYNYLPLFVLPLVLTEVAGYSLPLIGVLLGCRTFGVLIGILCIFRIADKADPRLLILVGFTALILPQWMMAQWGTDVTEASVVWAMVIQGFGSGIPYVGISALALATLPAELRVQGVSLLYLVYNLGVAIGAALLFNLLAQDLQASYELLSQLVSPLNEVLRLSVPKRLLDLSNADHLASLNAEIGRQSLMLAFNSAFLLTVAVGVGALPLILLARVRRGR